MHPASLATMQFGLFFFVKENTSEFVLHMYFKMLIPGRKFILATRSCTTCTFILPSSGTWGGFKFQLSVGISFFLSSLLNVTEGMSTLAHHKGFMVFTGKWMMLGEF